jgi:hypothetical protein
MANKKISQLPSVSSVDYTPTDILPIVNYTQTSGTTSQTLLTELKTYINSGNTVSISGGTNLSITGTYPNFGVSFTGSTGTSFTGGTVSGATSFTGGLSANTLNVNGNLTVTGNTSLQGLTATTISATTYQNLPVSGLTPGNNIAISGTNGNFTISVTGTPISSYTNIGSTGTSFNWNVSGVSTNYQVTLTANTTLTLTGVRNGEYGTLIVTQDAVGGRTLSLGNVNGASGTHRVANGGVGSVVLSSNPSITDILTFTYNGSTMYWTVGNDYS